MYRLEYLIFKIWGKIKVNYFRFGFALAHTKKPKTFNNFGVKIFANTKLICIFFVVHLR